jgi:low affinity Fe/Cu permease
VEDTNIAISIATLLIVFVLQNTQNRDSAALHLKMDEMIHAEPDAREVVRGTEIKSEAEIKGMDEEADSVTPGG